MREKKRGIIFVIILIAITAVGVFSMYIKKEDTQRTEDNMTLSAEEINELDDELQQEQKKLLAERGEYYNKCIDISLATADYRYGKYGINFNKEFVKEQCDFRSVYDMVEYEFLEYEEVEDLTEYMSEINWEVDGDIDVEMLKYGIRPSFDRDYVNSGYINKDGTFNTQRRTVSKIDEEGNLEDESVYEDSELMAVKLTVCYKNLSAKENIVCFKKLHTLNCMIYMEDGELYAISSAYRRNIIFESTLPVYTSMADRYIYEEDEVWGTSVSISEIKLEPYEEYVGELIYVFVKDEFENMVLTSNNAINGDNLNYKDIGTNIVFFSYLKERLEK